MLGSDYLSDWMWMASAFLVLQLQCMLTGPENWGQTWGHPSKPLPATKVWQFFECWVLVSLSTKAISMWRLLVQESKNLPTYLRTYLCDKVVETSVVEFHVLRRNSGFSYFCDLMGTPIRFCAEFFKILQFGFGLGDFFSETGLDQIGMCIILNPNLKVAPWPTRTTNLSLNFQEVQPTRLQQGVPVSARKAWASFVVQF